MGDKTAISWSDATWNPIVGCSIVSPGCTHCYAMKQAARIVTMTPTSHYKGTTRVVKDHAIWTGKIAVAPDAIWDLPRKWAKPRRIFVNSMGDAFHEDVPLASIERMFTVMRECERHEFQVLTKRSTRMADYAQRVAPLPNVIMGVSVEDQARADERRWDLGAVARIGWATFVSYEPALGRVDWKGWEFLSWLIAGGESGPRARPANVEWFRAARDWCKASHVAFHFKQWGEWIDADQLFWRLKGERRGLNYDEAAKLAGARPFVHISDGTTLIKVGKVASGHMLDGVEDQNFPSAL